MTLHERIRKRLYSVYWYEGTKDCWLTEPALDALTNVVAELAMDSGLYSDWYHGQQASIKRMDAQLSGCTGQVARRPKRVKT